MFDIAGRVAVITGAAQGIGLAFAKAFAEAGATPVLLDQQPEKLAAALPAIREIAPEAEAHALDISSEAEVDDVFRLIAERYGRLDVLINNAAIFSTLQMRPFYEIPAEEWRRVMDVNVTGTFLCCRAAMPAMRSQRSGSIVNMSSATVNIGRPNYLHYVASKGAIVGVTRAMAREVGDDGIRVNAILPGATDTGIPRATVTPDQKQALNAMRALKRDQTPEDLVGVALFLASDAARFVTGQCYTVDGGHSYS